ncbi:MAG: aminotransferase class I/II-fold pyridoxal phosphate-dependent enzyme, partial [Comamonadaceae bacterium]
DPDYTVLRESLGALHAVAPGRIVLAASASEFIHRATAWAARRGTTRAVVPAHSYGDYPHAAQVWGLAVLRAVPGDGAPAQTGLHWACEPSSPLGIADAALDIWRSRGSDADCLRVLDCAYVPLRLDGVATEMPATAWQLWTPNKALGLTGVRGAYAVAPAHATPDEVYALNSLAPSWPLGTHGVALLAAWARPSVQAWVRHSLHTLRDWKAAQLALCQSLGWAPVSGSLANYFVARLPVDAGEETPRLLQGLRGQGIKLRDCASFGLPGHVRVGVLAPASQQALAHAWVQARSAVATMPLPPSG